MKTKIKNLITICTILVFSMIGIASSENNSNVNNEEATEAEPMDYIDTEEEVKTYKCQWCSDEFSGGGRHMNGVGDFCSRKCVEEYRISESFK